MQRLSAIKVQNGTKSVGFLEKTGAVKPFKELVLFSYISAFICHCSFSRKYVSGHLRLELLT